MWCTTWVGRNSAHTEAMLSTTTKLEVAPCLKPCTIWVELVVHRLSIVSKRDQRVAPRQKRCTTWAGADLQALMTMVLSTTIALSCSSPTLSKPMPYTTLVVAAKGILVSGVHQQMTPLLSTMLDRVTPWMLPTTLETVLLRKTLLLMSPHLRHLLIARAILRCREKSQCSSLRCTPRDRRTTWVLPLSPRLQHMNLRTIWRVMIARIHALAATTTLSMTPLHDLPSHKPLSVIDLHSDERQRASASSLHV
mmetsp:Transcript_690/g.1945  ORF Transcript_690/g.1945 Transcript_690/m.1945 type:complete len:251 (-) Transcript_690:2487-3239(-)